MRLIKAIRGWEREVTLLSFPAVRPTERVQAQARAGYLLASEVSGWSSQGAGGYGWRAQ